MATVASCTSPSEQREQIDMILTGSVYTVNSEMDKAGAIAIHEGVILAVGTSEEILSRYEAKESVTLLNEKTIYPGFYDPHCHFYGQGMAMLACDLTGTVSLDQVLERLKTFSKKNPENEWLLGRGWDQNDWETQDFPTKTELDQLFPDKPVYLSRIDGHAALVNQKALDLASVTEASTITGGDLIIGTDGKLTGILIDNATELVASTIPTPSTETTLEALQLAESTCFQHGLTSLADAGLGKDVIQIIQQAQENGDLKIRTYIMAIPEDRPYWYEKGKLKTDRMNVRSFKIYADGALGSRGALLLEPYSDAPDIAGLLLRSSKELEEVIADIYQHDWQANTHCIGDSANRLILDLYGKYLKGQNDQRWRIEHAQIVHPDDLSKYGQYSIIPSIQATHATSDMYWAGDRLGDTRIKTAYAYQALLQQSGTIANGSDFPVEHVNPLYGFHAAVARQDAKNYPEGGYQADDALTRQQALQAMTIWAAHSCFEEKERGSIEPGKMADFTILEKDIMTTPLQQIRDIQVTMTIIGGEIVYTKP